jgi:VWFA-related protein
VETISLDLAVRDRHNRPILDLKPEELTVADNGKPAKLAKLRLVNGAQQDEPLITLVFDRPGMEDSKKRSEDSLFGTSTSAARENSKELHQMASRFLSAFPSGGSRFAVVDVWGRLQIQQEYSADRKAVAEAVSTAVEPGVYGTRVEANAVEQRLVQVAKTGQDSTGAAVSVRERTLARSMYTALQTSSHITKDQHLSPLQACLLALAEAQESLPGRKAIIYFNSIEEGSGDPYQRSGKDSHAMAALKSIIGAANRAGVNIYVVLLEEQKNGSQPSNVNEAYIAGQFATDSIGHGVNLNSGNATTRSQGNGNNGQWALEQSAPAASKSTISVQEDMNMLAKQTGDDVLIGSERMARPVKDLVRSLTTYYEASFVPPSGVEDGTFHTTAFKTSRKGLRMRGRTGHLAMPPSAGIADPPQPFEVPLMALLKDRQLPEDVDFRARVMQMEHVEDGDVGLLALDVPVSGLEVRTDSSTHLRPAHVSVLGTINDSAGTEIERFSEDTTRRWSAGSSAGTTPAFISFERSFAAPPGTYILEAAILDNNSGKGAASRQRFEISASSPVPELSDLMVVRGIEPPDVVISDSDLLWHGARQVLPNLYGELPASAHNVSVFFLAHTDRKSQAPATVKLDVLRNGERLTGEPLTSTIKVGDEISPVMMAFSISSAANGKYEVRATLTQGDKSTEKSEDFVLLGEGGQIDRGGSAPGGDAPIAVDPPGLATAEQTADRPSQEELDRILADARKNTLDYADALPNLICLQTTQ